MDKPKMPEGRVFKEHENPDKARAKGKTEIKLTDEMKTTMEGLKQDDRIDLIETVILTKAIIALKEQHEELNCLLKQYVEQLKIKNERHLNEKDI